MDEPFYFSIGFLLTFVFPFFFLAKIGIPKIQYKWEGRGLNMLDDTTPYIITI